MPNNGNKDTGTETTSTPKDTSTRDTLLRVGTFGGGGAAMGALLGWLFNHKGKQLIYDAAMGGVLTGGAAEGIKRWNDHLSQSGGVPATARAGYVGKKLVGDMKELSSGGPLAIAGRVAKKATPYSGGAVADIADTVAAINLTDRVLHRGQLSPVQAAGLIGYRTRKLDEAKKMLTKSSANGDALMETATGKSVKGALPPTAKDIRTARNTLLQGVPFTDRKAVSRIFDYVGDPSSTRGISDAVSEGVYKLLGKGDSSTYWNTEKGAMKELKNLPYGTDADKVFERISGGSKLNELSRDMLTEQRFLTDGASFGTPKGVGLAGKAKSLVNSVGRGLYKHTHIERPSAYYDGNWSWGKKLKYNLKHPFRQGSLLGMLDAATPNTSFEGRLRDDTKLRNFGLDPNQKGFIASPVGKLRRHPVVGGLGLMGAARAFEWVRNAAQRSGDESRVYGE